MLLWQALKHSYILAALSAISKKQELMVDNQKTAAGGAGSPPSSRTIADQA